ncbi:hypothetical protein KDAU_51500 [Dictyobacter aurantiacus]|uniref:Uncharacterized protein n=1 Tax=Dictyobacter aurantiacus TaxID=1936993 RepID=A0A401ZLR2_9CHLR|nr:hypothetical protein KDAU_51500 [Dictyobacter aurantiacus]
MLPLTWVSRALCAESEQGFCIDERYRTPVTLALRVYPPGQGLGLAASLVPRSRHERRFNTFTKPQAPRMLDEPGGSLFQDYYR